MKRRDLASAVAAAVLRLLNAREKNGANSGDLHYYGSIKALLRLC
jgi:hypothetical protein